MNEPRGNQLVELLELDRELLERVSRRTHQWGQATANLIQGDAREEIRDDRSADSLATLHGEAASLFMIAGSYRMLFDIDAARASLLPAARHFHANGSSFVYPLAICAQAPELALESLSRLPLELTAEDRANVLLALGWIEVTAGDRFADARDLFREHLLMARPAAQAAVGRMRIPLGALTQTLEAADRTAREEEGPRRLIAALHDALMRMHDVTAAAMADRYHWRGLMSSVLPVEPEAVVLAGAAMAVAQRAGFVGELLEGVDLSAVAQVPLLVAMELTEPEATA